MPDASVDRLLQECKGGTRASFDHLVEVVYPDLMVIARALLRRHHTDPPYESAELVHEAYLKLVRYRDVQWRGPAHFFGAITQTMRRLLIDRARAASALKRQGRHVSLERAGVTPVDVSPERASEWADLLERLATAHPRWAQVVECRCALGLTIQETAEALGVSHCTVSADWQQACQWVRRELDPSQVPRSEALPASRTGERPVSQASTAEP